jgi:hypothetical protein
MADDNDQTQLDTDSARAGATPGMTRYILAFSLVAIVVIFVLLIWGPKL